MSDSCFHAWPLAFLALICGASQAQAETKEPAIEVTTEVGLVSDYRFRGISLSDRDPAFQGGVTVGHRSGLYVGIWGSTLPVDGGGTEVEVDSFVGYSAEVSDGLQADVSILYYAYPGQPEFNYFEGGASLAYTLGALTPKVELAFAPGQDAVRDDLGKRRGNFYISTGFAFAVPGTRLILNGQIGRESGPFDNYRNGAKWDWQAGGAFETGALTLSLAYCASNARVEDEEGNSLSRGTLVVSAVFSF